MEAGWLHLQFKAAGVNARNAYAVYGLPGPGSWLGFAHALSQRVAEPFIAEKVIFVVHDHHFERDTAKAGAPFRARRSTEIGVRKETIVDHPEMKLQLGLFLPIGDRHLPDESHLRRALSTLRFAGGVIDQGSVNIRIDTLGSLWKTQPRGHVVLPEDLPEVGTPLESLIWSLTQPTPGWVRPSIRGYEFLTPPLATAGGRFIPGTGQKAEHVLAEPLLGLVRYQSVRAPLEGQAAAWHYTHQPDLLLFEADPVSL